ncbi:WD40 repeat-like protein [Yamadazyma tenuis ATCC 10573]|uniref:Pre-mRNA-processing factor 17 n=2 Tax=Candida tenuis TaxID=2315449 RepID=G3B9X2_CANTC|nr:WD40 repeat-like protein [Yamadazyma tenuis ATCC 10573]EGV61348.1 WD40 repeat-like protein [Yamadazyma tenuis ATCC 10573]
MNVPQLPKINLMKISGAQECFVPKKVVHKFPGHDSGVSKVEFFPNSGHLLLSCGNDSIVRLWDVYHKKELIREYYGHSQAVKDIAFNLSGDKFLSCSFDKKVILWDTETGTILKTIKVQAVPTVLKFNPNNDNEFLVGLMNSNIEHYDIEGTSHNLLQTYDHHVGSINALCVIQHGNKFLSSSDDKSIRIWSWGINIPVKTVTHPTQYAVSSALCVPPSEEYIALQNMNNAIQVIDGEGKFKFKKKVFKNENVTGYKIEIDISPDGKILVAGDSKGNILLWDWNSGKVVKKLNLSKRLISTVKFHPQEQSKVAAAGTDGAIYYCD